MTLDDYQDEKIRIGDTVEYTRNINDYAFKSWGLVAAFKHGGLILNPAHTEWDFNEQQYKSHISGPFNGKIRLLRKFEEVRKPGIEDLI